ncbi:MAG: phage holin family protein [Phycisphaerae bacterium]|nr:phage holin family protein [Phycisphaerae bacterium]
MGLRKDRPSRQLKSQLIIISVVLIVLAVITVLAVMFLVPGQLGSMLLLIIWLFAAFLLLTAVILILLKIFSILRLLAENSAKLEKITETLEKDRDVLMQINQNTRISETVKAVAFRDANIQSLREAVFDKLQQQDYDATYEIIDEIALRAEYKGLAEYLRNQANNYRDSTDTERVNQVIAHIEKLFDISQWAKASAQIERLIWDFPKSEKAKAMRQKLLDKKEERKKILLNAWDDAVKRQATDRSLEILRELDLYLTPNEGLALQEAAKDVFRNKLHNLGVQFSLAVSGKQWERAIETGGQIIRDFPNSKMAEEIHEKWDILKQKAAQQKA